MNREFQMLILLFHENENLNKNYAENTNNDNLADDDYQSFGAKRFFSADDGSGEEIVGDKAGDGEGGDIHDAVVGQLHIGLLLHLRR